MLFVNTYFKGKSDQIKRKRNTLSHFTDVDVEELMFLDKEMKIIYQ